MTQIALDAGTKKLERWKLRRTLLRLTYANNFQGKEHQVVIFDLCKPPIDSRNLLLPSITSASVIRLTAFTVLEGRLEIRRHTSAHRPTSTSSL